MAITPVQPNIDNTKLPYREAKGTIKTDKDIKPLPPQGHLVHDTLLSVPQYFLKDIPPKTLLDQELKCLSLTHLCVNDHLRYLEYHIPTAYASEHVQYKPLLPDCNRQSILVFG